MTEKIKENICKFKTYISTSVFADELEGLEDMLTPEKVLMGSLFFEDKHFDKLITTFVKTFLKQCPDEMRQKYAPSDISELREQLKLLFLF